MTPKLVAITDRRVASAEATLDRFAELGQLARPGSVVFQLRDLELSVRERLSFGEAILHVARATGQLFVVNDRVDFAVLLAADGVHLGEASIPTAEARRLLGDKAFVSRACHDPAHAAALDADAVLVSPVLEARKGRPALGLEGLREACRPRPGSPHRPLVYALGGVSAERASECISLGADGLAVVGAIARGEGAQLLRVLDIAR